MKERELLSNYMNYCNYYLIVVALCSDTIEWNCNFINILANLKMRQLHDTRPDSFVHVILYFYELYNINYVKLYFLFYGCLWGEWAAAQRFG